MVDLWNRLPKVSGLVERTDYTTLERHIFAKPYFDREGFSVAVDDGKIIGFAHAGFSPQESLAELDYKTGIVSQMRLDASVADGDVANTLLKMSVDYCRGKGAATIHAGCFFPHSPFYLGLYGGSRLPGVIEQDQQVLAGFKEFGFVEHDQIIILELQLSELTSIMGRQQMSVRRNYLINASSDPIEQSWWESCTLGVAGRERFTVINKRSKEVSGTVSYGICSPCQILMPAKRVVCTTCRLTRTFVEAELRPIWLVNLSSIWQNLASRWSKRRLDLQTLLPKPFLRNWASRKHHPEPC